MITPVTFCDELLKNGITTEIKEFSRKRIYHPHKVHATLKNIPEDNDILEKLSEKLNVIYENNENIEIIKGYIESLSQHLSGHPDEPNIILSVFGITGEKYFVFELSWKDRNAGNVVWSNGQLICDDIISFLMHVDINLTDVYYSNRPKPIRFVKSPLFKYHPERYKQVRKFFAESLRAQKRNIDFEYGALTSVESLNEMITPLINEVNEKSMRIPLIERLKTDNANMVINSELGMIGNLCVFHAMGKQILDINPSLTEMFENTDVNDIPLSSIKLPYLSQYIHFGKQKNIELEDGWFFDGAYVELFPKSNTLKITITSVPDDEERTKLWHVCAEPMYHQSIPNADSNIDLITAVTQVFSDKMNELSKKVEQEPVEFEGMSIVSVTEKNNVFRKEIQSRRFEQFQMAIRLIVNAVCYLTAYPEDSDAVWTDNAPKNLVNLSKNGNEIEKKRSESKLSKLGYTKIRYFGKHFDKNRDKNIGESKGKVATHWRKGHWTHQAYGVGRKLRKLLLLMPMLINKPEDGDSDIKGHIYTVD